jgi:hypothetical protein
MRSMTGQISDHLRYQVVVRGRLGQHLTHAFGHLEIDSRPGQTTLTGTFIDSAELYGLLDRLRDLGIHLISVSPVNQGSVPPNC